ncbi:transcriptional regulator [Rugosimonospora africana]|uniref:Transcriptional regulator n=1 Tax=Rugosimonospora africana TaxID=556532 RepID=A0A8J3R238_9ACTN|nr:transcriptional regulator [Rugosimonospora africana]
MVLLGYDGVQGLDLTGPLDVFAGACEWVSRTGSADPGYRPMVASPDGGPFRTTAGMTVMPDTSLAAITGRLDTVVVPGGAAAVEPLGDRRIVDWLRGYAPSVRRVTSVCAGAFLLAEAGLLDGRRATTHWSACARLAERYPAVRVDPDSIYVHDGDVYTSAGVTAGMDLALALVEADLGRRAALTVARWLVMFLHRPGNQAQFSVQLTTQYADHAPVRELQRWLGDNYGADLTVDAMASRARMSPRHFARSFRQQTGTTPGRYLQRVRLEAARRRLEESDTPAERIAAACGFGSAETMRRVFVAALGMPPAEYRRRFRTGTPGPGPVPGPLD